MIRISHLTKSFGEQSLFSDVSLTIAEKERIGLIGRNGSGKSTFLKILLEQDSYESGSVELSPYFTIRALEQHLNFSESTILQQVCAALPADEQTETWRAKSILMGLGFTEMDFERAPSEFSSGFQVRVRLAEALVSAADLLLLDEPTNYLDILSLRWLERFLQSWPGAFLLVTHDQNFMSQVVSHVVGIHRGKMRKMKGTPPKLLEQIEKEEEVYEKTRVNMEKKQAKTKEFISKFRAGARSAGLVQSRIKSLEKQEVHEKLEKLPQIAFHFRALESPGGTILEAKNIAYSYVPEHPVIAKFSLEVQAKDRIAIIGRNGKGKSTLLQLLVQKLTTETGRVKPYSNLRIGYFAAANKSDLHPDHTILEELIALPQMTEQQVRNVCGSLLFTGNAVKKKISQLSGGEQSRVCLGKVILSPSQLLVLDEPTNHLDMESCAALIKSLHEFPGTVIFVTHDEDMISALATRLVVFDAGKITVRDKTYAEFLVEDGWSDEEGTFPVARYKSASENKKQYMEKKEQQKKLRQLQNQQTRLEKEVVDLESQQNENARLLQKAYESSEHDRMRLLGIEAKSLAERIGTAYEELEKLLSALEEMKELAME